MRLDTLFDSAGLPAPPDAIAGAEISAVTDDSRRAGPGVLFVAVRGSLADGHGFVGDALAAGSPAVVVRGDTGPPAAGASAAGGADLRVITAADSREALGELAHAMHGHPARAMTVVGVTGTNGKTTTATMIERVMAAAGLDPAFVGTVGYRHGGVTRPAPNTTPSAPVLAALLADARRAGARGLAIELSSHAADQRRTAGLPLDVAVFTNLTQDHLDYHGTMEDYFQAKRRLFVDQLVRPGRDPAKPPPVAVVNADDPYGARLIAELREPDRAGPAVRVIAYGAPHDADVWADDLRLMPGGTRFTAHGPLESDPPYPVALALPGLFNISNALAVWAACRALDIAPATVAAGLAATRADFGRFEPVDAGQHFTVLVDYAHTPDALENVLRNARPLVGAGGRLTVVFGCGGDRDTTKRAPMGEAAGRLADLVTVTSDNPRTEDPAAIADAIVAGLHATPAWPAAVAIQPDRRAAIHAAVMSATTGDVLVIAGKGHENYQITAAGSARFDDREVAREALAQRKGRGAG